MISFSASHAGTLRKILQAQVVRVIDGDTLKVEINGRDGLKKIITAERINWAINFLIYSSN